MESVKIQTYKNIQTIVHSDDPRDKYVTGDVIIHGTAYTSEFGNGTYNLYNNRLLKAIPDVSGWYHFIDDDDEYASPDVIEKLVKYSKRDCINVGRVRRIFNGKQLTFPKDWGGQKSFQTEIFFLHTDHKDKAKWWGDKGGDHNYSKQFTKILKTNWIDDLIICKAQETKGNGRQLDEGGKNINYKNAFPPDQEVCVIGLLPNKFCQSKIERIRQGEIKRMPYGIAFKLEQERRVKITNYTDTIEKAKPKNIYNL